MKKNINLKLKTLCSVVLGSITMMTVNSVFAETEMQRIGERVNQKTEASQLLNTLDYLPNADSITSYNHEGIAIQTKDGKVLTTFKGDFGSIDHRSVTKGLLVATIDTEHQHAVVTLFNKKSKQWTDTRHLPHTQFKLEGVCLYQDSEHNGFLFLIGEDGLAQQWLVADRDSTLPSPKLIRNLSTPPNSEFCQVDDKRSLMYVNEENVGIWAYDANAEADLARKPVELVRPFGLLKESASGIQRVPNGLLIIDESASSLHVYVNDAEKWALKQVYSLINLASPKNLSARVNGDVLDIAIMHDDGVTFYTMPWSGKETQAQPVIPVIMPTAETAAVPSLGDAADDPAIWVNSAQPTKSRVLATDKQGGLLVYDMAGVELQHLAVGRINNVDIRSGFKLNDHVIDLAVASNRDHNALDVFAINPDTGHVTELAQIATELDDIYGLCMYKGTQGRIYTIANDKDGRFVQYEMKTNNGNVTADRVRTFSVASQPEGCVADDKHHRLFIGEENVAVWTLAAGADQATTMKKVMSDGDNLKADIEGMSLYNSKDGSYLVVSSQGNDSYVVLDALPPFTYRGAFRVGINASLSIDGASETDGLDVTSANLGGEWSQGMLVVQDGRNRMPEQNQNYKYIPWSSIATQLNLTEKH